MHDPQDSERLAEEARRIMAEINPMTEEEMLAIIENLKAAGRMPTLEQVREMKHMLGVEYARELKKSRKAQALEARKKRGGGN